MTLFSVLNYDCAGTCLIYRIDEGLGIISRQVFDRLDLITIGKDGRYHCDTFVGGKVAADQTYPGGKITKCEDTVKETGGEPL